MAGIRLKRAKDKAAQLLIQLVRSGKPRDVAADSAGLGWADVMEQAKAGDEDSKSLVASVDAAERAAEELRIRVLTFEAMMKRQDAEPTVVMSLDGPIVQTLKGPAVAQRVRQTSHTVAEREALEKAANLFMNAAHAANDLAFAIRCELADLADAKDYPTARVALPTAPASRPSASKRRANLDVALRAAMGCRLGEPTYARVCQENADLKTWKRTREPGKFLRYEAPGPALYLGLRGLTADDLTLQTAELPNAPTEGQARSAANLAVNLARLAHLFADMAAVQRRPQRGRRRKTTPRDFLQWGKRSGWTREQLAVAVVKHTRLDATDLGVTKTTDAATEPPKTRRRRKVLLKDFDNAEKVRFLTVLKHFKNVSTTR